MKMRATLLAGVLALGLAPGLGALPVDPSPVHGQVQLQGSGNFLQVIQQTPQAIINWGQFSIGPGETVRFLQPGQQAAILNRVTGLDPSQILGNLQANGRVFLLNPNGILFGPNAVVDVGSFTASTLHMSDEDFLSGHYQLTQDDRFPLAALTNQGTIRVAEGGFVVLVSPLLDNQGMILAQSGQVQLGASRQASFSVDGRGLVQFVVPDGFDPKFQGGGQGGTVLLQPGQLSQLLNQVVTNPLLIEAGSFESVTAGQTLAHGAEGILLNSGTILAEGGTIRLDSSEASILATGGVLSASSPRGDGGEVRLLSAGRTVSLGSISATSQAAGDGGFVEVSGRDLWLLGGVDVTSAQGRGGTILLDPTDITIIDGAGGTFDPQLPNPSGAGSGTVSVAGMQGQSSVRLEVSNDVTYNGAGFALPATSLTIVAGRDILLTTTGAIRAASLSLDAGRDINIQGTGDYAVSATAGVLSLTASRDLTMTSTGALDLVGATGTTLRATNGNIDLQATGALGLSGGNAALNIQAGGDVRLVSANESTGFSGQGNTAIQAGRDLTVVANDGKSITLDGPRSDLSAGRNLTLEAQLIRHNIGVPPVFLNGQNVTLQSAPLSPLSVSLGSLAVNATQDFVVNASNGAATVLATSGDLKVSAGQSMRTGGSSLNLLSNNGRVILEAGAHRLEGANGVRVQSALGTNITSTSGDLEILAPTSNDVVLIGGNGALNVTSARDTRLAAGSGSVQLSSNGGTRLAASRDLSLKSSQGASLSIDVAASDFVAGRNLTVEADNIRHNLGVPRVSLSGQNVTFQSTPQSGLNLALGSLQVDATQDFLVRTSNGAATLRATSGSLNITAGQNLSTSPTGSLSILSNNGSISLTAGNLSLAGSSGVTVQSAQGTRLTSTISDLEVLAPSTGAVQLTGGNGALNLTSARDLRLESVSSDVGLSGSGGTRLEAGRDLKVSSGQGAALIFNSGRSDLMAGRNLTLSASNIRQTLGINDLHLSGQNVTVEGAPGGGAMNLALGSLNVTASQDFLGNSTGAYSILTSGPLNLTAGGNFAIAATGTPSLRANSGGVTITGGNLALANVAINSQGNGPLTLGASGNLSVGALNTNPNAIASLSGANIVINSMQNLTGGNYTITTPGNLTELTAATNPSNLAALNITAGRAFNANPSLGFSIPNTGSGNLTVLITGGNDTIRGAAASLRNFNGANVQPGHIEFQTGDIYVDGALFYGGTTPPQPPPPPAPTPTPAPTVSTNNTLEPASLTTPEERTQILASSNLALGNLDGFSRVRSEVERERFTSRQDPLHQTWPIDRFSPTLSLAVPGGPAYVSAGEASQLENLFWLSRTSGGAMEQNRQAYNVLVDLELREFWEVRYWRHLIESFVVWEDRE
jgi:filamentous hemagglutinin family protein